MKRRYSQIAYYPSSYGMSTRNIRRRYNSSQPYGSYNRYGIGSELKFGLPMSYTETERSRNTTGNGVTSQYDTRWVYKKKSMPKYKRRRWIRFCKKVNASLFKDIGTKTIVRNGQLTQAWTDDGQRMFTATIYGADGGGNVLLQQGNDDLKTIFNTDTALNDSTAKAIFGSAVLDLTIQNASYTETNQNTGLEIDIYDVVFRKQADCSSFHAMVTNAGVNTNTISGMTALTIADRGVTLFEFPNLGSQGMKILSKKKYFLSKGQVCTYQLRDPKNHKIVKSSIDTYDDNFIAPGLTRTLVIIVKGVPVAFPATVTKEAFIGVTRKYSYKQIDSNVDADGLV